MDLETNLAFHGASSSSYSKTLTTLDNGYLAFSSHGIINLAKQSDYFSPSSEDNDKTVITSVERTLRSNRFDHSSTFSTQSVITALSQIQVSTSSSSSPSIGILAAGYSQGEISIWLSVGGSGREKWKELVLETGTTESITDISGACILTSQNDNNENTLVITAASVKGLKVFQLGIEIEKIISQKNMESSSENDSYMWIPSTQINYFSFSKCGSLSSVLTVSRPYKRGKNEILIFCGTALPRHNRIWVLTSFREKESMSFYPQGFLLGHEDWVTCLAWTETSEIATTNNNVETDVEEDNCDFFLASGSHDAKIRLWRFHSIISSLKTQINDEEEEEEGPELLNGTISDDDDDDELDEALLEEGEARLTLVNRDELLFGTTYLTHITLEALLIGHDESISSVSWSLPSSSSSNKLSLLSASMDKSIFLWSPDDGEDDDANDFGNNLNNEYGIWIPKTRLGSAGGILGGSIGSSLLGFLHAMFWDSYEGSNNDMIVGVGYGGSLHFWKKKKQGDSNVDDHEWIAQPCLTGHFRGVSDLDWDSSSKGDYLLTVSLDQTCRLWTQVPVKSTAEPTQINKKWMEISRPQVHGYDLNAVICVGSRSTSSGEILGTEPKYRFVSGADEKQLRVFDAPVATLRLLHGLSSNQDDSNEKLNKSRVERAFIPSLGLSNKGTMEDNDAQDTQNSMNNYYNSDENKIKGEESTISATEIPLERDLGCTTLWPEVRKLYGHESELVCLASNSTSSLTTNTPTLVASACKARNVEQASIRLWNVDKGICADVLKGGHRSTVSTLSFSPDGSFLVSS